MNKRLLCGIYAVSVSIVFATIIVGFVLAMMSSDEIVGPNYLVFAALFVGLGYVQFMIVQTVLTLILLYKSWRAIEDGVTPVKAGKAIGFLFIPFFNIYWFFRVWGGYPLQYNNYLGRHRLSAPRLNGGIYIVFALTVGLTAVVLLPFLILPLVTLFLIARGSDAINNLEAAKAAANQHKILSAADFVGTPENPRSKGPIFVLSGALGVLALGCVGFAAFVWFNVNPSVPVEALPAAVGNFKLQKRGGVNGSFFGGQFRSLDNLYVDESNADKRALRYNVFEYRLPSQTSLRFDSNCKSNAAITMLKDRQGKEAGRYCIEGGVVWAQIGRFSVWAHAPAGYDLKTLNAKEASMDSIVSFVQALPSSGQ